MPLPHAPFTPAQLAVRRRVWDALGELFLDTDTRPSLPLIARRLAESGLDEAALGEIWREEVTPALLFNLTLVAGEWGYFDLDWLEERIVRRRAIRHRLRRWSLSALMQRVWSSGSLLMRRPYGCGVVCWLSPTLSAQCGPPPGIGWPALTSGLKYHRWLLARPVPQLSQPSGPIWNPPCDRCC